MLNALICACFLLQSTDFEKGIKAKEVEVRLATVQVLVRDSDPKTEKLLVAATRDEDWEVALRATEGLGERGAKSAVDALVKLALEAPIRRIRVAAARSLLVIAPDESATVLARRLATNDAVPALEALAILLSGRETKADLGAVAKAADKNKDENARAAAAAVVGAASWKEREKTLAKIIGGDSVRSASAALDSIAQSPRAGDLALMLEVLAKPKLDDCVERRAVEAARAIFHAPDSKLDEAKIAETLAPLLASKTPAVVARAARLVERISTVALTNATGTAPRAVMGPDLAVNVLKPALEHTDPLPRATAAKALAKFGIGAIEVARSMAKDDKSPRVRRAAFESMCKLGAVSEEPNRAVALHLLATDVDAEVRRTAAVKLGVSGLVEVVEPLTVALLDKDWGVAVCAAVSLGLTQAGPAIEPLAKLTKSSPDWKLRAAAVVGLSRLYLTSTIPPTIEALADTDPFVVRCAHAQLMAVARERFEPKRDLWLAWWEKNKTTVILVDPKKQEEMRKRFSSSETSVPEIFRDMDVVVLESRGDHIEKVLESQKIEHRKTMAGKITANGLTSDGLFIANCTGEIEEPDVERLRWFVLAGGHLFGSCWALHETIERALPGPIAKYETASEVLATVEARVCAVDSPYLEGVFLRGVQPMYALEGAHVIDVREPERAEVLIDSPECADAFGCGNLAAWFEAGHGTVLDSANHFEAQGLQSASNAQKPIERQAYAVDHMGLPLDKLRAVKNAEWWSNSEKASREITDLSVFRLVTNFVRLRRLER
ncbi:MAG: HEAT repeat domain-containing protein [Planctomycetota bacterium]|nr:HEAT repeat domain-containing protein [Planctomycetota bacterium]